MNAAERAFRAIARPVYRTFFERPLWWFLAKLKTYFLAEISERLSAIEAKLQKLDAMETSTAAQWDGIEQLILAILRHDTHVGKLKDTDPVHGPDRLC